MNRYRVYGGIAQVGPGQVMELNGDQIRRRAHNLQLPEGYERAKDPKALTRAVAKTVLQFKVGEIVGLPDVPTNLVNMLAPLDGIKTEADAKAADLALRATNPKAHAQKAASQRAAAAAAKAKTKADK